MINNNNKKIINWAVAGLLVLLTICALFLPTLSAKVNITSSDNKPYNSKFSLGTSSEMAMVKDAVKYDEDQDFDFDDLTVKEQIKFVYYIENSSDFNYKNDLILCALFMVMAILVFIIASRATYILTIILSLVSLANVILDMNEISSMTLQEHDLYNGVFWFYSFSSNIGLYLQLILSILILIASAVSIRIIISEKETMSSRVAPMSIPAVSNNAANIAPSISNAKRQLTCVAGEFKGATFSIGINDELVIGRDGSVSNIVVVAPKISRKHCVVKYNGASNCYTVTDYSSNGTFNVNNNSKLSQGVETRLNTGTTIALGNNDNQFRLD